MTDPMLSAAMQLGTITVAVWGLTETIGAGRPGRKPLIAVGIGIPAAMIAHAVGFLTEIPDCATFTGCDYLGAAFAGLVCTVAAKLVHDGIIDPIANWRKGTPVPAPADTTVVKTETTVTTPTELPPAGGRP